MVMDDVSNQITISCQAPFTEPQNLPQSSIPDAQPSIHLASPTSVPDAQPPIQSASPPPVPDLMEDGPDEAKEIPHPKKPSKPRTGE